ncbi:MAG: RluA family pseudouridine synthase, partial [Clostridia bacterium]|nr:RluA family pseudouridine synthase [Clostridia bacterium]
MKMTFLVDQAHDGVLLRSFLKGTCAVSSRMLTRLKQMPDGIRVNGLHSTVRTRLKTGDVVEISSADLLPQNVFPPEQSTTPVRILYEDDC